MLQKTIGKAIKIEGKGIHRGRENIVTIYPLDEGRGIIFQRLDVPSAPLIEASEANVYSSNRCTVLGKNGVMIYTVEHLLAALFWMGVDSALIQVEGDEIPVLDGSALPFVRLIKEAGIAEFGRSRETYNLEREIWVKNGEAHIVALPCNELRITYCMDFNFAHAGEQIVSLRINEEVFEKEIAPARTFGFLHEVEELQKAGLALGGSLENAVVLTEEGPSTPLRFKDELVRHKVLDLLGDLALLGRRVNCHIIAIKSGHLLNYQLVKKLSQLLPRR